MVTECEYNIIIKKMAEQSGGGGGILECQKVRASVIGGTSLALKPGTHRGNNAVKVRGNRVWSNRVEKEGQRDAPKVSPVC